MTPGWSDFWRNDCYLIRRHLLTAVSEHVPKLGQRILDFGCGAKPYQEFAAGKEYVGVDIAVSGHDHTNSQIDCFYDGKRLNFPDCHFDAVFSIEVLEHLFNYDDVLGELWRVLRPGGTLFLTTPFIWPEHEQPYDYARYSTFGVRALLEKHQFSEVQVKRRGHPVESICQLALFYCTHKLLLPTRFFSRVSRCVWCSLFNLAALGGRNLLPSWPDIYLSNTVVAMRPAALRD